LKKKSYIFFKDKDDFKDLLMSILEEHSSYKSELFIVRNKEIMKDFEIQGKILDEVERKLSRRN